MKRLSVFLSAWVAAHAIAGGPTVSFTYIPPAGSYANLAGSVSNVANVLQYGVAVYINVFGTWWQKPTDPNPITSIFATGGSTGTFVTDITTGGACDTYASQIAAYIVPTNYTPPAVDGLGGIPPEIAFNSIASLVANKPTAEPPFVLSGYSWTIKDTGESCAWGPGDNHFLGQNVRLDGQGLHLQIAYTNGAWCCSEVMLTNSLGYGTYRVYLNNDLSNLPPEVVFGFFTWSDDTNFDHREIDVEFSNGNTVGWPDSWQYVIQPYYDAGQRIRFPEPAGMATATHSFTWIPGKVWHESYTNHVSDYKTFLIQTSTDLLTWSEATRLDVTNPGSVAFTVMTATNSQQFYRAALTSPSGTPAPFMTGVITNGVPPEGTEAIHINLWLNPGETIANAPTNRVFEAVISKFEYLPIIQPVLTVSDVTATTVQFTLQYGP